MPFIHREKLSNQVYTVLKDMITNHRFQPGARLNVEQLAKELDVSRTPVWEAVGKLEQEGFLVNVPNRGVFMAVLTPKMSLELYAVREVLEGMAARLAAERISEETLKEMENCLAQQAEVIQAGDLIGYSRLDFDFHAAVYESCGNEVLQELLQTIKNKMRPLSLRMKPVLSRLYHDHEGILDALRMHDPQRAERAFRRHNRAMIALIRSSANGDDWGQGWEGVNTARSSK